MLLTAPPISSFPDLPHNVPVQKGDRHELKREESEKKGAKLSAVETNLEEEGGTSSQASPSNGTTLKTPNHTFSEVSATKMQVFKQQRVCSSVMFFKFLFLDTFLPVSLALKETCLGVEGTNSNGVAGGINGELGSNGDLVSGNGVRLRVDSTVVGGDREVLGGGNGVLRGGNGVLRSNTGFVSI